MHGKKEEIYDLTVAIQSDKSNSHDLETHLAEVNERHPFHFKSAPPIPYQTPLGENYGLLVIAENVPLENLKRVCETLRERMVTVRHTVAHAFAVSCSFRGAGHREKPPFHADGTRETLSIKNFSYDGDELLDPALLAIQHFIGALTKNAAGGRVFMPSLTEVTLPGTIARQRVPAALVSFVYPKANKDHAPSWRGAIEKVFAQMQMRDSFRWSHPMESFPGALDRDRKTNWSTSLHG